MKFIGIIPARYQSTRFPGKPLVMIHGKPMICHVVEQAEKILEQVWVATDNRDIARVVTEFNGKVLMTSALHRSGTDRCAEAARILAQNINFDAVINIQGDEPFIRPEQIGELMNIFTAEVQIATLIKAVNSQEELENPNKPKVVVGRRGEALYFSRFPVPYFRGEEKSEWLKYHTHWAHIGMYGYRKDILQEITGLEPGILETAESLEQLRWLENGYKIHVAVTRHPSFGIDTPEDLEFVLLNYKNIFS